MHKDLETQDRNHGSWNAEEELGEVSLMVSAGQEVPGPWALVSEESQCRMPGYWQG